MSYEISEVTAALKSAREKRGLTQRELSERSGVPQAQISKLENGQADVRISTLVSLSRALGLEVELVPRKHVPAVQAIIRSERMGAAKGRYAKIFDYSDEALSAASAVASDADPISEASVAASLAAVETGLLGYRPARSAYSLTDDEDE